MREFTKNTQQQLEEERAQLHSENQVLKEQLKESENYIDTHLARYSKKTNCHIHEVFHVYLKKFENAVTHLFLVISDNNLFPWVSLISMNRQSSKK